MKKVKPPVKWYGGKRFMLKHIIPLIPKHKTYVEVFGGSGALLFAKQPSEIEVYNDIHSGVVNLYRVLRDKDKIEKCA